MPTEYLSGTGTPNPGLPPALSSVEYIAPVYTWLSLNRYARIMGIDPVHFWGCNQINTATGRVLHPIDVGRNVIWPQTNWDNTDQVSREELARVIYSCEQEISDHIGTNLVPDWTVDEYYTPETHYLFTADSMDYGTIPVTYPGVVLRKGNFVSAGRRKTTLLSEVVIVYSDPDNDGFSEIGSIIVALPAGYLESEIKIYYHGYNAERDYEIRDPISVSISGGNINFNFYTWQLVSPEVYSAQSNNDNLGNVVDLTVLTNLCVSVDVYREYNDFTQNSVEFVHSDNTKSYGYFEMRDLSSRIVIPYNASYNVANGQWESVVSEYDYTYLKLSYYSGYMDARSRGRLLSDNLGNQLAKAIAYMATSRLERTYTTNTNASAVADQLRMDARVVKRGEGYSRMSIAELNNPFGTHYGEIYAFKALNAFPVRSGGGLV